MTIIIQIDDMVEGQILNTKQDTYLLIDKKDDNFVYGTMIDLVNKTTKEEKIPLGMFLGGASQVKNKDLIIEILGTLAKEGSNEIS